METKLTAKIFDIFTGQEIKEPSAVKLRKRPAKELTATGVGRHAVHGFKQAGEGVDDLLAGVRRNMN